MALWLASWGGWCASAASARASAAEEAAGPAIGWDIDGVWVTPVLGPAYTPELGLLIAGGAMLSFVADEGSPRMAMDPYVLAQGTSNSNFGAGPVVRFDSRDFPQNAFRGVLAQGSYGAYVTSNAELGGYQIFDLDYRQYLPIGRDGSVLAWALRSRVGFGDVPWGELGMLGSPFDLRGYRWGRYRQKTIAYGIVEYRFTFGAGSRPDGAVALSRHGIVGWLGAGTLGNDLGSLEGALPNVGLGYRFAVQGRLNPRVDIGAGRESQAVYFNFTEAF